MADWRQIDMSGEVRFIGWNPSRADSIQTTALDHAELVLGGLEGEAHGGLTRSSCNRVKNLFDPGTEIFNSRQLSVLSTEELDEIAATMTVPGLNPSWLGANLVLEGIPHLSLLPPSTRLQFESGATIVVSALNAPCRYPAEVIAATYPEQAKLFIKAAFNKRGFTSFVERGGAVEIGMKASVFIPDQPPHPLLSS